MKTFNDLKTYLTEETPAEDPTKEPEQKEKINYPAIGKYNYYIGSGAKNAQYTLRVAYKERSGYMAPSASGPRPVSTIVERDHYIKRLGRDVDAAIQKAQEYVDDLKSKGVPVNFDPKPRVSELNDYREPLKGESYIRIGRYKDQTIEDVAQTDSKYLIWMYFDPEKSHINEYQKEFIRSNFPDLVEQEEQRRKEWEAKRQAAEAQRKNWEQEKVENDKKGREAIKNIKEGQTLRVKGKIIKLSDEKNNYGNYVQKTTLITDAGFLFWFQTTRKEFVGDYDAEGQFVKGPQVKDVVEVEGVVSGKGDNIVFAKKVKMVK